MGSSESVLKHRNINRLNSILFSLLGSQELVDGWWTSPNRAFDGETPQKMLDNNPQAVVNYILAQVSGEYY